MSGTTPQLAPGQILSSGYRVERELGAGGMATVYLADDLKHRRKVAVKVLRPDLAASLGAERFLREIEIAAALQHPHILSVHDSGNADGLLFYVMPFVEGETLRARLRRDNKLDVTDAVRILRDVADALAYAHTRGVVHRDVKPENVLVSGRHALVADFGIAKAVTLAGDAHLLTSIGIAVGTPAYMSPEQAAGDPGLDHRADIYSFGVLAYELLGGATPFSGRSPQAMLAAHVTVTPEPIGTHRSDIPAALEQLVMCCLEKDRDARPQNADAIVATLEALLTPSGGMAPTSARRIAAVARNVWKRRRVSLVALIAVVVGATATAFAAKRSGAAPERRLIAVVPFENRTGDSARTDFGEVAARWLPEAIDRDGTAEAVAASTVAGLMHGELRTVSDPVAGLARRTGARFVLRGEYLRNGDSLEVRGTLVDARTGESVAPVDVVRGTTGGVGLLQLLELRTIEAIQDHFGNAAYELRGGSRPTNLEAFREANRGAVFYMRRQWRDAADAFAKAAAMDTMWAWPSLRLLSSSTDAGQFDRADSIIKRLRKRQANLGPVDLDMLALQEATVTGDRQREYQAAKRLYERAPVTWSYAMAYVALRTNRPREALRAARLRDTSTTFGREWYAWTSVQASAWHYLGEHDDELRVVQERRALDPVAQNALDLELIARAAMGQRDQVDRLLDQSTAKPLGWESGPGRAYMEYTAHGHVEAARAMLDRAVGTYAAYAKQPGASTADSIAYATALFWSRDYESALAWWRRLAAVHPNEWPVRYSLANALAASGRRAEALRVTEEWSRNPPGRCLGCVSYNRAIVSGLLGDRQLAADLFRQALGEGFPFLPGIHRMWAGIGLADDPRIRAIIRPQG